MSFWQNRMAQLTCNSNLELCMEAWSCVCACVKHMPNIHANIRANIHAKQLHWLPH